MQLLAIAVRILPLRSLRPAHSCPSAGEADPVAVEVFGSPVIRRWEGIVFRFDGSLETHLFVVFASLVFVAKNVEGSVDLNDLGVLGRVVVVNIGVMLKQKYSSSQSRQIFKAARLETRLFALLKVCCFDSLLRRLRTNAQHIVVVIFRPSSTKHEICYNK